MDLQNYYKNWCVYQQWIGFIQCDLPQLMYHYHFEDPSFRALIPCTNTADFAYHSVVFGPFSHSEQGVVNRATNIGRVVLRFKGFMAVGRTSWRSLMIYLSWDRIVLVFGNSDSFNHFFLDNEIRSHDGVKNKVPAMCQTTTQRPS